MHTHFMECYGDYLKEHYSDLSEMTCKDLHEAKEIAETLTAIMEADKEYNIVKSMEDGSTEDVDMTWSEFITRFKRMYGNANADTKVQMKQQIESVVK